MSPLELESGLSNSRGDIVASNELWRLELCRYTCDTSV